LWKDITKWLAGNELERVLGLFTADTQGPKTFGWDNKAGEAAVARGLEPGTPPAEWSFVPVTDLLLVVGDGIVGATSEGIFAAANMLGHKRLTLAQCYKTVSQRKPKGTEAPKPKEGDEAKGNGKEQSRGSKWDVQGEEPMR